MNQKCPPLPSTTAKNDSTSQTTKSIDAANTPRRKELLSQTPFIAVEGETFFSDRFYLNAPTGLSPLHSNGYCNGVFNSTIKMEETTSGVESDDQYMKCKCQDPPPLFDRVKLIKSLNLKAAIIGTYTICPKFLSRELPMLFPEFLDTQRCIKDDAQQLAQRIPTLVLHGTKGFDRVMRNEGPVKSEKQSIDEAETEHLNERYKDFLKQHNQDDGDDEKHLRSKDSDDDIENEIELVGVLKPHKEVKNRTKKRKKRKSGMSISLLASKHRKRIFKMPIGDLDENLDVEGENAFRTNLSRGGSSGIPGESSGRTVKEQTQPKRVYDEKVHFTEVQSCYLPPGNVLTSQIEKNDSATNMKVEESGEDNVIIIDDSSDEDDGVGINPKIAKQRIFVQGVHHPKFMILFEHSGAVVVVVSSANMTSQKAVDGSWVQRFEPNVDANNLDLADTNIEEYREKCDGSDFGFILSDFLQKQSEAAKQSQMLPIQFLQKYVGKFRTLDDFRRRYKFDQSCVHLVSTVPGIYPGRTSTRHLNLMPNHGLRILYGPQRIADILARLTEKRKDSSSHSQDHQRSVSNFWLPCDLLTQNDRFIMQTTSFGSKWTSLELEELVTQYMVHDEPGTVAHAQANLMEQVDIVWPTMDFMNNINASHQKKSGGKHFSHFVFLSSQAFNESEHAIVSQMRIYDNVHPSPTPELLTPHIKTYARLLEGDKLEGASRQSNHLAWAMLSSACFSKGAQGHTTKKINAFEYQDEKSYSNFELGVLFVSRIQGNQISDRLYTSFSGKCCCCNRSEQAENEYAHTNMVTLPFPFNLRAKSYQPDPLETSFSETPFFDKMSINSICSGMCLQTPFGKWVASRTSK